MSDEIICPYCQHKYDWEDKAGYITYWGDDGPTETQCPSCDKRFLVEEIVIRSFEITKLEDAEEEDCFEEEGEDND